MKRFCYLFPAIIGFLCLVGCSPNPESLAKKYNDEIHAFLEQSVKNASGSAYNLAIPLYQAELLRDSLYQKGLDKLKDADAIDIFCETIEAPENDAIFKEQWARVVEKCRSQLNNLPTNTWMINEDTMSPSSIFKVNKGYTEIYPYNYRTVQDLAIPSNKSIPGRYSMIKKVFLDYDTNNERMEIRTLEGKVGHFRKASTEELVMGHYANSFGEELYVTKNSKIAVKKTRWEFDFCNPVDVTQFTIDGEIYARAYGGVSKDRSDAIDALLNKKEFLDADNYMWRRLIPRIKSIDFLFNIPEDEINVDEMGETDEMETE